MIYVSLVASDNSSCAEDIHKAQRLVVRYAHNSAPGLNGDSCGYRFEQIDLCRGFDLRSYFQEVARVFTGWLDGDRVTCIVSRVAFGDLNPLNPDGQNGESLLAMLVLAFPEIRWLFSVVEGEGAEQFMDCHGLKRLFTSEETGLFDGLGLRDEVRKNIREKGNGRKEGSGVSYLPERIQTAVAMDEETDYAYLYAWAAYRFGFRVHVVSRKKQAQDIFCSNGKEKEKDWFCLAFEDVYLNFPDDSEKGLSDLEKRSKEVFPSLDNVPYRVLVTSGHDVAKQRANRSYIRNRRDSGKWIRYLYKPHAGIISLWKEAGLSERRFRCGDVISKKLGVAPRFKWPPKWSSGRVADDSEESSGHSSPGILVEIARHMLNRAERVLNDGIATVEQAVHGAVLASDALELLGGMTPTMSAEALVLKHQFELHAECQFSGVEHHLSMGDRLEEIKRDAEVIARWFHPDIRKKTALNIHLDVVNKLVHVLRNYNQFDEERFCMVEARRLHRKLYVRERWWRRPIGPFVAYANLLLSSFPRFIMAIGVWVTGTWLIYDRWLDAGNGKGETNAFDYAIGGFFGVNTVPDQSIFSAFVIIAGLFHLGIFISLIYDLLNRR